MDLLGSIREVIDSSAQVQSRYLFDAFGKKYKMLESVPSKFAFANYYVHDASGLYLTWFRNYSPELGRWLSRDPFMERTGTNLFAYVENDPVRTIDGLGLSGTLQMCAEEPGIPGLQPGHCYLVWKPDPGSKVKAGPYGLYPDGVRENDSGGLCSYPVAVDDAGEGALATAIKIHGHWSVPNNCCSWALHAWFAATGTTFKVGAGYGPQAVYNGIAAQQAKQ